MAAADISPPNAGSGNGLPAHSRNGSADDLLPITMDISDGTSVSEAMHIVEEWSPGGLDALVTFAAIGGIGPLMETPSERLSKVMDINVVGTHRTVLAGWRLVQRAGGRVILIGSEAGSQHSMPLNGPYAMSKHAMEAYADALRRELMFVGVPVVLMQPGPFRTEMISRVPGVFESVPAESPFKPLADYAVRRLSGLDSKASDPSLLADAVFDAATASRPRIRYPVGINRSRALLDLLPVAAVDGVLKLALTHSESR